MRVLLIGNDGRVYAMAKNMKKHKHTLAVIGGREYMDSMFEMVCRHTLLDDWYTNAVAERFRPDLIVPVSWEPSYAGTVDMLRERGYTVFGASKSGVALEADKEFGLSVVSKAGVPVAPFCTVRNDSEIDYVMSMAGYCVVKQLGFAGGRGVTVFDPADKAGIRKKARLIVAQDGVAMLQKKIEGTPVNIVWMQTERGPVPICLQTDYKRTYSGNLGPFCGAMGAVVWNCVPNGIVETMIAPLSDYLVSKQYFGRVGLDCMYEHDTGKLYAIEWTARWGTPTTEVLLHTLDVDLALYLHAWSCGLAGGYDFDRALYGVGVVLAGGGYPYPDMVKQGMPMKIKGGMKNLIPIGVEGSLSALRTQGGRHMVAVGRGKTLRDARLSADWAVKRVSFEDMLYRIDIGADIKKQKLFEQIQERWG